MGEGTDVVPGAAVHDHARVDALPALHPGHDPQQRVLEHVPVAALARPGDVPLGHMAGHVDVALAHLPSPVTEPLTVPMPVIRSAMPAARASNGRA
ncbi:hypothetical protein SCANM63S_09094 [Streptomyces canarius]